MGVQQGSTAWEGEVSGSFCHPAEDTWTSHVMICVLVSFRVKLRQEVSSPPHESIVFEVKGKVGCLQKGDSFKNELWA